MNRSRKKHRKIHLSLPEELIIRIEERFFDPVNNKPIYGIYAKLISGLLQKWLADPTILPIEVYYSDEKGK